MYGRFFGRIYRGIMLAEDDDMFEKCCYRINNNIGWNTTIYLMDIVSHSHTSIALYDIRYTFSHFWELWMYLFYVYSDTNASHSTTQSHSQRHIVIHLHSETTKIHICTLMRREFSTIILWQTFVRACVGVWVCVCAVDVYVYTTLCMFFLFALKRWRWTLNIFQCSTHSHTLASLIRTTCMCLFTLHLSYTHIHSLVVVYGPKLFSEHTTLQNRKRNFLVSEMKSNIE